MTAQQSPRERAETCPQKEKIHFMELRLTENTAAISAMREDVSEIKVDTKVMRRTMEKSIKDQTGPNKPLGEDGNISPTALKIILSLIGVILLLAGFNVGQIWPG